MQSATVRNVGKAYLISIGVWCVLAVPTGWQYYIFDQSLNIKSTLFDMLRLAEARGFTLALLTPPIFYVVRRYIGVLRTSFGIYWPMRRGACLSCSCMRAFDG